MAKWHPRTAGCTVSASTARSGSWQNYNGGKQPMSIISLDDVQAASKGHVLVAKNGKVGLVVIRLCKSAPQLAQGQL